MNSRILLLLPALLVPLAVLDCSSEDEEKGSTSQPPAPTLGGANGVTIHQVALYQGPKRPLMLDGLPQPSTIPIIDGRDSLLRIFYSTAPEYDGQSVTARLRLAGQDPIEVVADPLAPASVEHDLASTINIPIPGDRMMGTFDYGVSLLQERPAGEDNPTAHYPGADVTEPVAVDGIRNTLRMIVVPFAYHFDGSGRVPDTSPEQMELFRQQFQALYPITNVELTVHEPIDWQGEIQPDGTGWMDVGIHLYGLRGNEGTPDDVYYYGIFNPAGSLMEFCGTGLCMLGVTMLNNDPPETGSVMLRLALGVGFPEEAVDTMCHETGHAHGLEHADCGPGLDPQSIDHDYPHADGSIGVWGFDVSTGQLKSPDEWSDVMGYCNKRFISDYHFEKLYHRGKNVNLPSWHGTPEPVHYEWITVDGSGVGQFVREVERRRPLAGKAIDVEVLTEQGAIERRTGRYFFFDHLPGGWMFVPATDAGIARAEFVIDGVSTIAVR